MAKKHLSGNAKNYIINGQRVTEGTGAKAGK